MTQGRDPAELAALDGGNRGVDVERLGGLLEVLRLKSPARPSAGRRAVKHQGLAQPVIVVEPGEERRDLARRGLTADGAQLEQLAHTVADAVLERLLHLGLGEAVDFVAVGGDPPATSPVYPSMPSVVGAGATITTSVLGVMSPTGVVATSFLDVVCFFFLSSFYP
jgi:hypothetical protein